MYIRIHEELILNKLKKIKKIKKKKFFSITAHY